MNSSIKIGVVGCGWIAENAHIPALKKIKNVEILSLFDTNQEQAIRLAQKHNIKSISSTYDSLLDSDVDAVIITTPNYTHGEYMLKALEKGKHVLCEKPFTISSREAKDIIKSAQKRNTVVIPGFVNRFRYDIEKMCELISQNEIGKILHVEAGWIRKSGVPRPGTWFTNKSLSGGGVLIDLGSHVIDICLMLLDNKTVKDVKLKSSYTFNDNTRTSASWFETNYNRKFSIDVEEAVIGNVTFEGGVTLQVNLAWMASTEGDHTYFTVYGEHGSLELKTLFGFSNQGLWPEHTIRVKKNNGEEFIINFNKETNNAEIAFCSLAQYFIDAIEGSNSDFLTLEDGYNDVSLIEALYYSEEKTTEELSNLVIGCV